MTRRKALLAAFTALGSGFIFSSAYATQAGNIHNTDGAFDANEWTVNNSLGSPLCKNSDHRRPDLCPMTPLNNTGSCDLVRLSSPPMARVVRAPSVRLWT